MSNLDERSKKILWAIIKSYIACNGPVGSRTVTRKYSLNLSPATIRNTMADLEELGYLTQPHTSAGRIPTERGYRLYVDSLLKEHLSINKALLQKLSARLNSISEDINRLIKEASMALSIYSCYLGMATPPRTEEAILKRIEFIKHRSNRVHGVLISEDGIVKHRLIAVEEGMSQRTLDKITRYLNEEMAGLSLSRIKEKILRQMSADKAACDRLITSALKLCENIILWEETPPYVGEISGTCNLPDFATMAQIKNIINAIENKHLIIKLLDNISDSEGVQVFIGSENVLDEMKELSIVASTYNDGERILGTLGIIGPTRMNYERVISIVETTAKTVTQILSGK